MDGCCAPGRDGAAVAAVPATSDGAGAPPADLLDIPGGSFRMGSVGALSYDGDGEGPIHVVELSPFRLAAHTVSNDDFAAFVEPPVTSPRPSASAGRSSSPATSPTTSRRPAAVAQAPWWRQVYGADWRHPDGPQSDLDGRGDHPVVHVSWNDAQAYCAWQRHAACRPRRSGSTPRAAVAERTCSRGATSSSPAATTR